MDNLNPGTSDERIEALENKVDHPTQLMSSFMNQMSGLTFPTPNPRRRSKHLYLPIPPVVVKFSKAPSDIKLADGETSKYIENEIKENLDSLEKQIPKIKRVDAMGSVNFSELYVYPNVKLHQVQNARLPEV